MNGHSNLTSSALQLAALGLGASALPKISSALADNTDQTTVTLASRRVWKCRCPDGGRAKRPWNRHSARPCRPEISEAKAPASRRAIRAKLLAPPTPTPTSSAAS